MGAWHSVAHGLYCKGGRTCTFLCPRLIRARRNLALSKRMAYADTPKGADATEPEDGEPLRSWAGHTEAAVTASRFSHGSSAAFPNIVQSFKERN